MRTCSHDEQLLGRPTAEDSLLCGRRHAQGPGGARTFSVSLSSVKRYVEKAQRGESLAPKKRPGSAPKLDEKAMKLLEEDLEERPYPTLQERRDYVEAVSGISVSRSTMCRAIARIGPTRKRGGDQPPSATSS
jgi:transposase